MARILSERGSISWRTPPLSEVVSPSAILSRTGPRKTPLITLPSIKSLTIPSMIKDTHPLEMPRTLSPSLKTGPSNLSISSVKVTRLSGSTMQQKERVTLPVWPTQTDPPRQNVASTSLVQVEHGNVICGKRTSPRSRRSK
jgi:hypothetical protein